MKRRRREPGLLSTILVIAAAFGVIAVAVRLWPRNGFPSAAPVRPTAALATPTPTAGGAAHREEITTDERKALESVLRRTP